MNISNLLEICAGIIQALFVLYVGRSAYRYYNGKDKLEGKQEIERQERIQKYGFLIVLSSAICIVLGAALLIGKLKQLLSIF